MNLTLFSSAIRNGDEIPKRYTRQGADVSLPAEWYGMLTNPGEKSNQFHGRERMSLRVQKRTL